VTEIAKALHVVMRTSHEVATAMQEVGAMTEDFGLAAKDQEISTEHITKTILDVKTSSANILEETVVQREGIQQLRNTMQTISRLTNKSLESSQKITETIEELSTQADVLQKSIERFKLQSAIVSGKRR
jgi:methyl-accepting chemotaxis protein